MTRAMAVPIVAVRTPITRVLRMASCVAENSKNTKLKWCSVRVCSVNGSASVRVKAVLMRARYGKITVRQSTMPT